MGKIFGFSCKLSVLCIKRKSRLSKKPTYSELYQKVIELTSIVEKLLKDNTFLCERLSKYENPKNSSNSSIPPSQDENRPLRNQSLREKSGKKVGGQPGHKGSTLAMQVAPDEIYDQIPEFCSCCGKDLSNIAQEFIEKRQVYDIPIIKTVCKEYRLYQKKCKCGHVAQSTFPAHVRSSIQYGPNTEAMISYLHSRQYLSFNRIKECLNDVFGLKISEGGIHNLLQRFTFKANTVYQEIKNRIELSDSVGTDETGAKVNGKKHWYWVWQNLQLTYIAHSMNRGIDTIKKEFVKGLPKAILHHDRWESHFNCESKGHQLCISHLLRDLNYIEQLYESDWATDMKSLFKKALNLKKQLLHEDYQLPNSEIEKYEQELTTLLNFPINQIYKKAKTLQKNLFKHQNHIFTFLYYANVPPDNNDSERSIRNVKVKQKVSGQFKSIDGAQIYAINRSVIDTMVKSNQNIFAGLNSIANFTSD